MVFLYTISINFFSSNLVMLSEFTMFIFFALAITLFENNLMDILTPTCNEMYEDVEFCIIYNSKNLKISDAHHLGTIFINYSTFRGGETFEIPYSYLEEFRRLKKC